MQAPKRCISVRLEFGVEGNLTSISKSATALTANTTAHDGSCGELLPLSWRHHRCSGSCLQAARCADQCARWHLLSAQGIPG